MPATVVTRRRSIEAGYARSARYASQSSTRRSRPKLGSWPPCTTVTGKLTQAAHRVDVRRDVASLEFVEQRPVVDRIAGEQDPARRLPQTDAPLGMTGQMEHLVRPVAQIDHVAVVEQHRRRRRESLQEPATQATGRHGVDEDVGHVVPGIDVRLAHRGTELGDVERHHAGIGEPFGLRRVDRPSVELVHAADMIGVHVGGDRQQVVPEFPLDEVSHRTQPERRVDDHVEVATLHVPHVAPQQGVDVRLRDQGDRIVDPLDDEPRIGDGKVEHESTIDPPGERGLTVGVPSADGTE